MTDEQRTQNEYEQALDTLLEQRLKHYYGPELPAQTLPDTVWQQLRSQLRPQRVPQRPLYHFWRRVQPYLRQHIIRHHFIILPPEVEEAFSTVLFATRRSYPQRMLAYRSHRQIRLPEVRVSLLGRSHLQLRLPLHIDLKPVALTVLLAGGLARYEEQCRPGALFLALLLRVCIICLACGAAAILLFSSAVLSTRLCFALLPILSIALLLWLIDIHGRTLARKADQRMVYWLGRFQACQGLHALADHYHAPARRRYSELSLSERIAWICGTPVETPEEHLTLVH